MFVNKNRTTLQAEGKGHIIRMELSVRIFAAVALALFALTIVFIILAYYNYIHPAASLFSFMAILPAVCIAAIIHCCRDPVANHYGYDLIDHDENLRLQDHAVLNQEERKNPVKDNEQSDESSEESNRN